MNEHYLFIKIIPYLLLLLENHYEVFTENNEWFIKLFKLFNNFYQKILKIYSKYHKYDVV
jgi:hypothetical protein